MRYNSLIVNTHSCSLLDLFTELLGRHNFLLFNESLLVFECERDTVCVCMCVCECVHAVHAEVVQFPLELILKQM